MPGPAADVITVVSGLPRSGTSVLMQMLAAGGLAALADEARPPDEDNPRGYLEYDPVKRTAIDASWVPLARGKAVKVVHLLLAHLPPGFAYDVIVARRRIEEVLASQRRMLERHGRAPALGDAALARVFSAQLAAAEQQAAARPEMRLLAVEYAEVVADSRSVARRIAGFCRARLDPEAMARAVDPALHRQRG
jgi:hypothetical protein